MPSLTDVVRAHTDLSPGDVDRLHRLTADWQLLADLSFADLVLWVLDRTGDGWWVAAQMRPTTGPTVYADDLVGRRVGRGVRPQLDLAHDEVRICREHDPEWLADVPVREETIPVVVAGASGRSPRVTGRVIGVVSRHTNLAWARTPSRLEITYLTTAAELAQMLAEGRFPFPGLPAELDTAPRVGDGLVRLDPEGLVTFASPNALSAYRRLGVTTALEGAHLATLTAAIAPERQAVDDALQVVTKGRAPRGAEVEANGSVLQLRAIPLTPGGQRTGAVVLVRDVTELRRLDRQLLTKDATIREIHHRVKNNLQTVAALLRLQARRLESPAARTALEEAVHRVGSIALVHETLSLSLDESVAFDEIADRVAAMVVDVGHGEVGVRVAREGSFGTLAATVATPLALVLTELLQNALEHGTGLAGGTVEVRAERRSDRLVVQVADDGAGLPPGFDWRRTGSLGLQIVRTLVGELGGTLTLADRPDRGAQATVDLPVPPAERAPAGPPVPMAGAIE